MPPTLFVPEGWELEVPNDDLEKRVYHDESGARYRPVRYLSGTVLAWAWLPIQDASGSKPVVVEPSLDGLLSGPK